MLLRGRNVVSTSAGSIGGTIAQALLREGAQVEVWDISEHALERLKERMVLGDDSRLSTRIVNVTSESSVENATRSAIENMEYVDTLVCGVALLDFSPVASMSFDRWRQLIDVNLNGVFLCNRAFVPHMIARQDGSIINMSSVGGLRGMAHLSAYCASKFAVNGMSEALAQEVGQFNVRVNAICPGHVDAAMGEAAIEHFSREKEQSRDEYVASVVANTAMRRLATPEDVANAVIYLASDLSSFVTGEWLEISGGLTY